MKVIQSPSFTRKVKKFHEQQKKELDRQVLKILENPRIGQEKKGDLKDIHIHKFKIHDCQFLLAYRLKADCLELIMIGSHENYYRNLKIHV